MSESLQDNYTSIEGSRIRYWDTGGKGEAVLLCGGVGSSVEIWQKQFATLPSRLRIIAWDYPGHGKSSESNSAVTLHHLAHLGWQLLTTLGVNKAHVVGNSMGAAVALRISHLQPLNILSVGLLSGATLGREMPLPFRLMTLPLLGKLLTIPGELAFKNQLNAIFANPESVDRIITEAIKRNAYNSDAQAGFLHCVQAMSTFFGQKQSLLAESRMILSCNHCPCWMVHGDKDNVIPSQHSQNIAREFAAISYTEFANCGHTPQVERADDINALILSHCNIS